MVIQQFSARCRALGTKEELKLLREALTYEVGRKFRGRQPKMSLFEPMTQSFPAGLLTEAAAALRGHGVVVAVNDLRERAPARRGHPLAWLEPHQRAAVDAFVGARIGCVDMPTASGKGEVITALVADLDGPWIVLCDDKAVFHELSAPLQPASKGEKKSAAAGNFKPGRIALRLGELPGRIGDGCCEGLDRRVVVAMLQSLDQHWDGNRWSPEIAELLASRRGRAYDEVHMSGSQRSQRILRALDKCVWSCGFSATVDGRSDKRDAAVRAHFGVVVYSVSTMEMELRGVTAERIIRMVRCDQPGTEPYDAGGYQGAVSLSKHRNQLAAAVWRKEVACGSGLVYVKEIEHLRYVERIASALGLRWVTIEGDSSREQRLAAKEAIERGEAEVLFATNAFKQGADIIHVRWGMNLAGGMDEIGTIQRPGRSGRSCRLPIESCPNCQRFGKKGEEPVRWYDCWDWDSAAEAAKKERRSGPGSWLLRHTKARLAAYQKKGLRVEVIDASQI